MAKKPKRKTMIGIGAGTLLLGLVLAVALVPTTTSNHMQTMSDGKEIMFLHGGTNQWWVQVQLKGEAQPSVTAVDAQATGGNWVPLNKQTWSADGSHWAASFFIEPGSDVRFRVATPTADVFESCWFTHPAGIELCDPVEPEAPVVIDPMLPSVSHLRYVEDGSQQITHLTWTLDDPIALESLTELRFFQELVYGTGGFGFTVILGVNVEGDTYEADDIAWHLGATEHDPSVLGTDTFLSMDGAPTGQFIVDAPQVAQWWTPNAAGDGFAGGFTDPDCYATLETVVNDCDDVRFSPSDEVHVIRLILGGSGSWMDLAMRATADIDGTLSVGTVNAE